MSTYLGPFYIRDNDIFIFAAITLVLASIGLGITLPFIGTVPLLLLTILFLLARGMLPAVNESTVYILFLTALLLAIFFPLSTVIVYIVISFVLLKLTRQLN